MNKTKTLKTQDIIEMSGIEQYPFPKYTTQFINTINSNAQGTRPKVVGQMSDLIQEFDGQSLGEWKEWYDAKMPTAIDAATEKIYLKFKEMQKAFKVINKDMIREWVKDLVYTKTYCGLKFQDAIIASIAKDLNTTYRKSTPAEESLGIDGYIGASPVQIKSETYKLENKLQEKIEVPIIYYKKTKKTIKIEYNPEDFQS